jgi:outer membrane protein
MKQSLAVVCLFVATGAVSALKAQAPDPTQVERIATVNFTAAVFQTAEGQREFGAVQTKYAPRQAQLQTLNQEVESLRKLLSSDNKLTDPDKQLREKSLDSKEKQLEREAEDFRNDSQADSQQVYQRIAQKMYTFLQLYAQQNGFTILIDRGPDATPVVWYAAKGVDVTDDLIKAYNNRPATTPSSQNSPARNVPQALPSAPSPH